MKNTETSRFSLGPEFPDSFLVFPDGFTEEESLETSRQGYCPRVYLETQGKNYPLFFYDLARVGQDFLACINRGENYMAEPGMIVVLELTLESMIDTVKLQLTGNYYAAEKPYSNEEIAAFFDETPSPQ